MKQDFHVFQGMRQDNHPIRQESKYLWEAHNIRFTARDDNTLLSMTNERGTKELLDINGIYVGHCIVGDYLVVFTRYIQLDGTKTNHIYRLKRNNEEWENILIYEGELNINTDSPIQTLGVYEGDLVQKVYWVDGVNQPRVINVRADKLIYNEEYSALTTEQKNKLYPKGCFDFSQELQLNEEVSITRKEGGGVFTSGTIQYAFTYYNKYGQETNIFYTTELYNTSFNNRGGSPEDIVSNTFHINITNLDTSFKYLRIYSIHRTSLNATPIVKIVADIELLSNVAHYIDTGREGTNIDPTKLLYIGGESIIANTITSKDNTLFLGNIKLKRESISDTIKNDLKTAVNNITTINRVINLKEVDDSTSFYEYNNQLSQGNTSTYKTGDKYRLGLQFQHSNGKWSEPIWLGDYTINGNRPKRQGDSIIVPQLHYKLEDKYITELTNKGYKKVRPLVVLPSIYDRNIIAQGILCPTVFSIKDRASNTPFAQSSWFFRPMSESVNNTIDIEKGATVSFKHLEALKANDDRGAEIQNMTNKTFITANNEVKKDNAIALNTFFVDQSILTLHSPDIEFDDSTKQALENNEFELNIVGLVDFKANAGDITIQTSSAVPAPNDTGFFHKSFLTTNYENKGLVAGMFYKSHFIDDDTKDKEVVFNAYGASDKNWELNWLIYPWHRTGSLNNDCVRPDNKGTRTSVLKRKVISNLRFSSDNVWLDTIWKPANGITPVSIFNSNEVSLTKIPIPKESNIKTLNYYGNVDSLITTDSEYTFYVCPNAGLNVTATSFIKVKNPFTQVPLYSISKNYSESLVGDYAAQLKEVKEPVRMKYKSTPHAVFAFNYINDITPVILPKINNTINVCDNTNVIPFWSNVEEVLPDYSTATYYKYNMIGVLLEGTKEEIEAQCIARLKEFILSPTIGDLALMPCSLRPNNLTYADIYKCTNTGDTSTWEKVIFSVSDEGNVYTDKTEYFKVVENSTDICLKQISPDSNYNIRQDNITSTVGHNSCLFLAELKRKTEADNIFGGNPYNGTIDNQWIPAGKSVALDNDIYFTYGDTYYQRYDCLKTYSFTDEDENSVIEIASFMCESRINLDGRYDRNRGQISNLNMSPINFNLMNNIYSQRDNFFNYRILDKDFYRNIEYPTQVLWSLEKSYLEDIDTWTNITLANSLDLNGNNGIITALETFNDTLIAFQDKAINQILFNSRVQIPTSDGVPVEISNNYKVDGTRTISDTIGCQDKFAIAKSSSGLYFVDSNTDTLYLFNGQLQDISNTLGAKYWMKKYHSTDNWTINSTNSIRLSYDSNNKDLYLSPSKDVDNRDALCYSEQLNSFTSLMSYSKAIMFNLKDSFYSLTSDSRFNRTKLWGNFAGDYNEFYGSIKLPDFTYICNDESSYTKIFDTIEYKADMYDNDGYALHNRSFDWIRTYNEYQDTEQKALTQSRRLFNDVSLRKKFRVWRGQIPREGRTRIRNPWTAISLGFDENLDTTKNKFKFVLHDISTKYTI